MRYKKLLLDAIVGMTILVTIFLIFYTKKTGKTLKDIIEDVRNLF
jgi:hypothetical protein